MSALGRVVCPPLSPGRSTMLTHCRGGSTGGVTRVGSSSVRRRGTHGTGRSVKGASALRLPVRMSVVGVLTVSWQRTTWTTPSRIVWSGCVRPVAMRGRTGRRASDESGVIVVPLTAGVVATRAEAATEGPGSDQFSTYHGFTVAETSGSAAATVQIYAGTDATGILLETIRLAAGASDRALYTDGLPVANSVFVVLTGTVQGSLRLG